MIFFRSSSYKTYNANVVKREHKEKSKEVAVDDEIEEDSSGALLAFPV